MTVRETLIAWGVLRPVDTPKTRTQTRERITDTPVLRLDSAGHAAAQRHMREKHNPSRSAQTDDEFANMLEHFNRKAS